MAKTYAVQLEDGTVIQLNNKCRLIEYNDSPIKNDEFEGASKVAVQPYVLFDIISRIFEIEAEFEKHSEVE